jgi:regulator of RNase E activity RraA
MRMPGLWDSDSSLFELVRRELFSAVVGDAMDQLGRCRQFLSPGLAPLDAATIVGRAMPVLEADVFIERSSSAANAALSRPFGLMFDALDDLKPGEVYVCTGASPRHALWGELMSLRARKLGATGAVLDGFCRGTRGLLRLAFPVISRGRFAQDRDPRGKVVDYRVPMEIDGVSIAPGDLVVGDLDGVCVVLRHAEEEAITRAVGKARGEKRVQQALEAGMKAGPAFDQFGIM